VLYLERGVTTAGEGCAGRTAVLEADIPAHGEARPPTRLDTFDATGAGTPDDCHFYAGQVVLGPLLLATDVTGADTAVYSVLSLESFAVTPLARHRESDGPWPPAAAEPAEVVSDADVVAETLVGGPGAPLVVLRSAAGKAIATRGPNGAWTPPAALLGLEGAGSFEAARTGAGTTVFAWVEGAAPARIVGRVAEADDEVAAQRVQGLALVELAGNAGALCGIGAVGEEEVGAHDPAGLAERGGERRLRCHVLEPGDQQAGGDQPRLSEAAVRSRSS
jgi:hypothetical protein